MQIERIPSRPQIKGDRLYGKCLKKGFVLPIIVQIGVKRALVLILKEEQVGVSANRRRQKGMRRQRNKGSVKSKGVLQALGHSAITKQKRTDR